jgi:hypothetical protein
MSVCLCVSLVYSVYMGVSVWYRYDVSLCGIHVCCVWYVCTVCDPCDMYCVCVCMIRGVYIVLCVVYSMYMSV